MHNSKSVFFWLIAVSLILVLTAGIASAATVTNKISFTGNLTNAGGTPLTGTYTVIFRLYNVASGGTALATDMHSVTATKGLYTTTLNFPASNYNGQQLYVSLQRSPDPEKTRTALYPVPYALSMRPGAVVSGSTSTSPVLRLAKSDNGGMGLFATTSGTSSDAVRVYSSGTGSRGVYGESAQNVGVYGKGKEGGYFTTNQAGANYPGNPALNVSTSYSINPGINIITTGKMSVAIIAQTMNTASNAMYAETNNDGSHGAIIKTWGYHSRGVDAATHGNNSEALKTVTYGDTSEGISVETYGENSHGVHSITWWRGMGSNAVVGETYGNAGAVAGLAHNTTAYYSWGVYGATDRSDHKWGVYTDDYIYAGGIHAPDVDLAEYMPVAGDFSPGTVLIIGPEGKLQMATTANDTRVAGIISTSPAIALGSKLDGNTGEGIVAISGRVPCKVDASYGAIHPGDLLSTSNTEGYAMKAKPVQIGDVEFYRDGTVLGKAMGSLESGTGTIEVLVTLQ